MSSENAVTGGESVRFTTWSATTRHPATSVLGLLRQSVHQFRVWSSPPLVMRHCTHRNPGREFALLCV